MLLKSVFLVVFILKLIETIDNKNDSSQVSQRSIEREIGLSTPQTLPGSLIKVSKEIKVHIPELGGNTSIHIKIIRQPSANGTVQSTGVDQNRNQSEAILQTENVSGNKSLPLVVPQLPAIFSKVDWRIVASVSPLIIDLIKAKDDPNSMSDTLSELNKFSLIPTLGKIISEFFGSNRDISELRDQLKVIEGKLFATESLIQKLANEIKDTAIKTTFKEHQANIQNLNVSFHDFLQTSSNYFKDKLRNECELNHMTKFASYMERELRTEPVLPLRDLVLRNNDLAYFSNWMFVFSKSLFSAKILNSVCFGFQNATQLESDLLKEEKHFENAVQELVNFIEYGIKHIKDNYMIQVKNDVDDFASKHLADDHSTFAENLYGDLSKKFYWRIWIVASYDSDAADNKVFFVSDGNQVIHWYEKFGRNLYIASTNNSQPITETLRQCAYQETSSYRRSEWYDSAETIHTDVANCLGQSNFNGLGVFSEDCDLQVYSNTTAFFPILTHCSAYLGLWTYERTYKVIAIAKEVANN